jgi:hypothetical protein
MKALVVLRSISFPTVAWVGIVANENAPDLFSLWGAPAVGYSKEVIAATTRSQSDKIRDFLYRKCTHRSGTSDRFGSIGDPHNTQNTEMARFVLIN